MKILWSTMRSATLAAVSAQLRSQAKLFRAVTMSDLVAIDPACSTGLYFFLDRERFMYVGRSASRALIERVPSHLDVRPDGWFGTLLKRLAERRSPPASPVECVEEALDLRLALLVADLPAVDLSSAEEVFRHALMPSLNAPKKPRQIDLDDMNLEDVG